MKATAHRSKTGQMFIVFAGALLVVVVICPLAAQGAEEYLWRAYTQGPKKKQDLLREANRRLKNLRLKASRHEEQELRWANDPDTRWLLTNRIPAMLILERELTAKPSGSYTAVLARLTALLGSHRLAQHLPELLPKAGTNDARLAVLKAMASLRGAGYETALAGFLRECNEHTPEDLICEAAEGLGRTGDKKHLLLLERNALLVRSELGKLKLAAARYLCGQERVVQTIAEALVRDKADPTLHRYAVEFFSRNPVPQAVPVMGRFAQECADEQLAMRAIDALIRMTGFGVPSTKRWAELSEEQEAEEKTEPAAALPPPKDGEKPKGLTREERQRLVQIVLKWWDEHPEERAPVRRRMTRSLDALKAENAPAH